MSANIKISSKNQSQYLKNTNEHVQLRVFEYVFHKFCGGKKGVEFCENKVRLIICLKKICFFISFRGIL